MGNGTGVSSKKKGRSRKSSSTTATSPKVGVFGGGVARSSEPTPVKEWDKDDGNYSDFTYFTGNKELKSWLKGKTVTKDWPKASDGFTQEMLLALHNYTIGSGRFNIPLRENLPFVGNVDEKGKPIKSPSYMNANEIRWGKLSYDYRDGGDLRQFVPMSITSAEVKKLEKALSRSFKHELDRGIVVARGTEQDISTLPKVGDITVNKAYTSTAYGGSDWANTLGYPVKYVIRMPKGSRVVHLSGKLSNGKPLSYHDGREEEILIRKNAVFRTTNVVVSLDKKTGKNTATVYQDFLGYGSPKKLSKRQLKGEPDYNVGAKKKSK